MLLFIVVLGLSVWLQTDEIKGNGVLYRKVVEIQMPPLHYYIL